jgi:hypothetical protein
VLEKVLTLTELKTVASLEDVLKINALLDMKYDMQQAAMENEARKMK